MTFIHNCPHCNAQTVVYPEPKDLKGVVLGQTFEWSTACLGCGSPVRMEAKLLSQPDLKIGWRFANFENIRVCPPSKFRLLDKQPYEDAHFVQPPPISAKTPKPQPKNQPAPPQKSMF